MLKSFKYKLTVPIEVSVSGDFKKCSDVVVYAPRPRDIDRQFDVEHIMANAQIKFYSQFGDLKKIVDQINSRQKKTESKDADSDAKNKGNDDDSDYGVPASFLFQHVNRNDFKPLHDALKGIFCAGDENNPNAKAGGRIFTEYMFDQISLADFKELCARYFGYFLSSGL